MIKKIINLKSIACLAVTAFSIFMGSNTVMASEEIYLTNDRVNFRAEGHLEAEIYDTLNYGTQIDVLEYDAEGWSKVSYNGFSGYIRSDFIKKQSEMPSPVGSSVQLLEWSDVKSIFTTYTPAEIYDIKTGLTYYVQSFSNGLHADVETLTQTDTDTMLKTFSGTWSWEVRPVWVTINGYTIAASINGMPHGGGTISDNGMNGQVCLHFKGSTTHNGNRVYAQEHQDVALEAYYAS